MVDKISDLSIDRILLILGRGKLSVSPEKIIIYGLFFIGVVIFVNWLLSITVIILKPFLYAALMLAVLRPEFIQYLTTEETILKFVETAKGFAASFALGIIGLIQLFCDQFNRETN